MAFTKITGPGIHTLTNIVSHNVKSSGIITAVNGNLNGWLAVGSTASFGGNVSIGGTLTYDDVTNVESVGIITAKGGLHVGAGGTIIHALSEDDGKVGIGTDSPDVPLHVFHPTVNNIALFESGDAFGSIGISDSNGSVSLMTTLGKLTIRTGGDAGTVGTNADVAMVIEGGGDVGIGTDNPGSRLHLKGTGGSTSGIRFDNSHDTVFQHFTNDANDSNFLITYNGTGGAELTIHADGNLGLNESNGDDVLIGTQSVINNSKLTIVKAAAGLTTAIALGNGNASGDGSKIISTKSLVLSADYDANNADSKSYLGFETDGTERLRIKSDGSVGIGTTIPNAPIHIQSSENTLGILSSTDDGANLDLFDNDTQSRIRTVDGRLHLYADLGGNVSNSSIRFFVDSSSEKVRFTNTGRVGIGTTNPTRNLQIGGLGVNANNVIRLGRRIASQNTNLPLIGHHSGDGTGSGLALCATSTNGAIHFFTGNGGNGFGANDNQERVVIKHDGKVGIGTTIPQERLHIHEGDIVIGQVSGNNTDIRNYIKFGRVDAPKAAIGFINTTGNGRGDILFMNSDVSNASEFTDTDELVRITHDGFVGIGTNNPSYKLDVRGNSRTRQPPGTDAIIDINEGTTTNPLRIMQTATEARIINSASIPFNIRAQAGAGSTAHLAFWTKNSERLRIESDGDLRLNNADSIIHTSADTSRLRIFGGSSNSVNNGAALTLQGVNESGGNYADLASGAGGFVRFRTGTTEVVRITNDGNVGIGTNDPTSRLHIETRTGTATRMTVSQQKTYGSGTGTDERAGLDLAIREASQVAGNRIFGRIEVGTQSESTSQNGFMSFFTRYSGSIQERMRIDAFGRILLGRTSNNTGTGSNPIVQIQSTSTNNYGRIELAYAGGNTLGPAVYFVKARGSTANSVTAAGSADQCGALFFLAADGNDRSNRVASIQAYTDGAISSNITPGKLVFRTTPDNDNATLERLSIDSDGIVQLNTANNTYIRGGIYAKYTGASGDTADINTSSAGKISWLQTNTEIFENGGFTNTATDVTVPKTGIYQVLFNGYLESLNTRTNVRFRYRINGTDSNEDLSLNNYIRRDSGHNESSVNFTAYLNLSAGDTVAVSAQAVGASGTVTMLKDHSSLTFHLVA